MKNAQDVISSDLDLIGRNLNQEFAQMGGKKLLITGGAGFLGYYLIQSVLYRNRKTKTNAPPIQVIVIDNFMRGIPTWLTDMKGDENLIVHTHDITAPLPPDIGAVQYIIHAASIASPIYYRQHPIETMDANVIGLRLLLDYCLQQKAKGQSVEGFLFFSSSEIYGDPTPENIPTAEDYNGNVSCTGPRACYDESKRYGETLCVNFARQHDLPIRIARPFNNYGPGLKISDRRVLPDFARNVLTGEDIVMLSDGSPTRTFCYVADAIIGYYQILINGRSGEAYNIGVDEPEVSIADLAEQVVGLARDLFNYPGQVVYGVSSDKEYLTDNPNRRCPLITKARRELGYNPSISLEEGLRRSLIWYADHQNGENA
jgi:nucleoside-diphosphate-sugar epimerase